MIRLRRALERASTVYAACAAALALGLFFIFVWTPLPWGWHGIDFYYETALALARGEPFPTMKIMWGYAYFLAFWYRLFGDHPWIPLSAQALINASTPLLLYHLVRLEIDRRVGVVSAALAGLFSFSNVYASTQASDAICTALFVATVLSFALGRSRQRLAFFALAGLLAGVTFQFRPNFLLFPFFAGGLYLIAAPRRAIKAAQVGVFVLVFLIVSAPWVIRNHRWSGLFIPATTHGAKQLWFGSLQTGAYERSWLYNPLAAFENPPVEYSSVDELPLVVSGNAPPCAPSDRLHVDLIYWTNRDPHPKRVTVLEPNAPRDITVSIPAQPAPAVVSYYLDAWIVRDGRDIHQQTPMDGASEPRLLIVSRDHLGDLDIHDDWLDAFDVARLARHLSWGEPLRSADRLDLDRDGAVTEKDLRLAITLLADRTRGPADPMNDAVTSVERSDSRVDVRLNDGSTLSVPRRWNGRITDLVVQGHIAESLMSRSRTFTSLSRTAAAWPQQLVDGELCLGLENVGINQVLARRQPHEMRRFTALALDNIRRAPLDYLAASARRAVRLFVVEGGTDKRTAVQFKGSAVIYPLARAASFLYLALFAAGVVIAVKRRYRIFMFLVPIAYVPATIAFMLITARYTTTIQPFVFVFIAVACIAALDRISLRSSSAIAAGSTRIASGRK